MFDFIEQEGPRENVKNIQLRWITKQLNNPKSPIHKWPERLVEKYLRNLANDGVRAQLVTDFHFTLADVNVCALKEIIPILRLCREKSLGFHGTAGFGKTPLARIICMAFSRYWVNKVKSKDDQDFARPANLIFFRGQVGRLTRPDLFDDGTFQDQLIKKLKAFADVGLEEAMTKERWGAAKFVMQQLRVWCVNDFDANAEPKDNMAPDTNKSTIAHQEFMDTLAPAWPKDTSKENILAVLKRSSICINTRTHNHTYLYVRPAGDKEVSVQRVRLPADASFLRPAAGERYIQYRHGNKEPHSSFQEHLDWEQAWLTALLEDKRLPPWLPSVQGHGLFTDSSTELPPVPLSPLSPIRCKQGPNETPSNVLGFSSLP